MSESDPQTTGAPDATARYRALPEPVRVADTVVLVDTTTAPDPQMGRDTETEFVLRHAV